MISIHALREEGDSCDVQEPSGGHPISIHALREEGDGLCAALPVHERAISIHALREEGDHDLFHSPGFVYEFLSTPSARRATKFKYPKQPDLEISIHALREEGDGRF